MVKYSIYYDVQTVANGLANANPMAASVANWYRGNKGENMKTIEQLAKTLHADVEDIMNSIIGQNVTDSNINRAAFFAGKLEVAQERIEGRIVNALASSMKKKEGAQHGTI